MLPTLYFSRPATVLPDLAVDNDTVISRLKESFRGTPEEWGMVEAGVQYVFDRCGTKVRYYESDDKIASPGEWAARAAEACLKENGVAGSDVDLVIYGGVARDAFEPATATEVAGRIGATPSITFDVTCACAGLIEALHVATAQLPRLPVVNPGNAPVVGTNTVAAMTSGVFWGYIGLIEGLVARIKAERETLEKRPLTVIGTGGLAPLFAQATSVIKHIDHDLTLRGLLQVHRRNAK